MSNEFNELLYEEFTPWMASSDAPIPANRPILPAEAPAYKGLPSHVLEDILAKIRGLSEDQLKMVTHVLNKQLESCHE